MKLLTLARDLRRRKARERQGLFVAEGVRTVDELLRSPLRVRGALLAPPLGGTARGAALRGLLEDRRISVLEVSEHELATASDTESPQGVLAIAEIPGHGLEHLDLSRRARLLILDGLQDPGNVGTILRTAAAFGAAAVLALPGTVDLWNAKVVRGAMGSHFRHPAFSTTWETLSAFLASHGVAVWGADAAGEPLDSRAAPPRLALLLGNEGAGITPESRAHVEHSVALPISPSVESLNVAVAAGIFLYELRI